VTGSRQTTQSDRRRQMLGRREYLLRLEQSLMLGSGRWVADFVESFWDCTADGVTFDLLVRGGMRARGFAVSRVVALLTTPDYRVACFAYSGDRELSAVLQTTRGYMQERQLEWAWLVIIREGAFPARLRAQVERDDRRELGIALVNLATQEIVTSRSYVGRRMDRFIRCFR